MCFEQIEPSLGPKFVTMLYAVEDSMVIFKYTTDFMIVESYRMCFGTKINVRQTTVETFYLSNELKTGLSECTILHTKRLLQNPLFILIEKRKLKQKISGD